MQKIILASSSPFRKQLLAKLRLPFITVSPDINETRKPGEGAKMLVRRLSREKAQKVACDYQGLIIASDQVATVPDKNRKMQILTKPGNFDNAFSQLKMSAGKTVTFINGLSLLNTQSGRMQTVVDTYAVTFRKLDDAEIIHYLKTEKPYQSAGSIQSENLGIALFEKMTGDDPNSLIGLPLIRLVGLLKNEGVRVV